MASPRSQARARLGPGGYCRRSGNGGPQTCLPAAHGVALLAGLYNPSSSTKHSRPSRGTKPHGADDAEPPQARPRQAGSRGGEEIKAGYLTRCHDASHDDSGCQVGASPRIVLLSSLVQRGQAQPRSTEASGKGCHFGATRPRPGGLRDGGHHGAQDGVITRALCRRRLLLSG